MNTTNGPHMKVIYIYIAFLALGCYLLEARFGIILETQSCDTCPVIFVIAYDYQDGGG